MAFTRTWSAAYEAQPADTENISLGASRIRNLKVDIKERLEIDHFHAGDAQDGEHKKITLGAPIATPANIADKGFIYGKDVGGKIELHYLDEDDNEVQLTNAGAITGIVPSGTSMIFHQTTAPDGWTKQSIDDKALRVVSGTASSGGADAFTTVFASSRSTDNKTLSTSHLPTNVALISGNFNSPGAGPENLAISNSGGGSGHSHVISDMDLLYEDVIIADKD